MKEALLVIDVQKIYTDNASALFVKNNNSVIRNINKLIKKFRINNLPIIFIKHQHKKDKSDLGRMFDFTGETDEIQFLENNNLTEFDERIKIKENDVVIIKTRYCAFEKTNLEEILKGFGVNKITICGFMTNFCCETAARTAHGKDYYVDFIVDATGTPGTEILNSNATIKATVSTLSSGFAVVKKTKEKFDCLRFKMTFAKSNAEKSNFAKSK